MDNGKRRFDNQSAGQQFADLLFPAPDCRCGLLREKGVVLLLK